MIHFKNNWPFKNMTYHNNNDVYFRKMADRIFFMCIVSAMYIKHMKYIKLANMNTILYQVHDGTKLLSAIN